MSLVIICGATATGKSDLAISVAKEINAEIVNRSIEASNFLRETLDWMN